MYKLTLACGHITERSTAQDMYYGVNNKCGRNGQRNYYDKCEICGRQIIIKMEHFVI
jgi:hypothetical protein